MNQTKKIRSSEEFHFDDSLDLAQGEFEPTLDEIKLNIDNSGNREKT